MSGVTEEADTAFVVGGTWRVLEERPYIWFLHRVDDFLDVGAPLGEVGVHVFFGGVDDPLIMFPLFAGAECHDCINICQCTRSRN